MRKLIPVTLLFILFLYGCDSSTEGGAGTVDNNAVQVTGISIASEKYIELDIAQSSTAKTAQINAGVEPANADNKNIFYTSEDENVAAVNKSGLITAKAVGVTKIKVISEGNPAVSDAVAVVVYNSDTQQEPVIDKILAIEVNAYDIELDLNAAAGKASFQINAVAKPDEISEDLKTLIYSSNEPEIAGVDNNGLVTAKATGNAVITITSENNPEVKAQINVAVVDTVGLAVPEKIILIPDSVELDINPVKNNDKFQIEATVLPAELEETKKGVNYTSDAPNVAAVSGTGLVTAKSAGNAVITVSSYLEGGVAANLYVSVKDTAGETVEVNDIYCDTDEVSLDLTDKITGKITASALPADAQNRTLKYSVEPPGLASINNLGEITARNTGSGTITIQSESNPAVKKTILINITNSAAAGGKVPIEAIGFEESSISLKVGETYLLTPKFTPANTTERDFTLDLWTAQYGQYIDFDKTTGLVTAKAPGKAWPEIKSNDNPSLKGDVEVTVIDENGEINITGLKVSPKTITVNKNYNLNLANNISVNYEPANTTQKNIKFVSESPLITINENGFTRVGDQTGTAVVKVQSADNPSVYDTVTLNIINPQDIEPPVYSDVNASDIDKYPERMYIKIMFDIHSSSAELYNTDSQIGIQVVDFQVVNQNTCYEEATGVYNAPCSGTLVDKNNDGYRNPYGFCIKYGCMYVSEAEAAQLASKNAGISYYVSNNNLFVPVKQTISGTSSHTVWMIMSYGQALAYYRKNEIFTIDYSKYNPSVHKNVAKFHYELKDKESTIEFLGFEEK